MITPKTSLRELAFLVCTHLKNHNITAVLTGGSAVTVYTHNHYQSNDLDFISAASHKEIEAAIEKLGFLKKERFYRHPDTELTLDFPTGPLNVGTERLDVWETLTENGKTLYVLTPTQSVKDRLSHYYHWNDLQCLDQAVWVAKQQIDSIELVDIEKWSRKENYPEKFQAFLKEFNT